MNSQSQKRIDAALRRAADEIKDVIREEVVAALPAQDLKLRKAKSKSTPAPRASAKSAGSKSPAAGPKSKRTPEEMEAAKQAVLECVKSNPGQSIEEIGRALGRATSELTLPVKKLIADKAVKTKGEKRATRYFSGKSD